MNRETARDVMTTTIRMVGDDWPLSRLTEYLIEHDISGAPVVNAEGRLVGVVSATDVVRHESLPGRQPHSSRRPDYFLPELEGSLLNSEALGFDVHSDTGVSVRDIMTPTVFEIDADTPVGEVADTMLSGRIHRLLVTEKGMVVGLVTAFDLLALIRDG